MKKFAVASFLIACLSSSAFALDMTWTRSLQKGSSLDLMRSYKALTEPVPMRRGETPGFTLDRPGFKLALGPGALFSEADDSGAVRGLYYEGAGTLSFSVSDAIEREHLKLFVGQEALNTSVESVYILPLGACADLPAVPAGDLSILGQADYTRFKSAFHAGGMTWLESALNRGLHGD